jgi:VIT1/CCC1 family predicted Fe2+/Mn2+ transporter
MAAGNYSATRTEHQELDHVRAIEERHIRQFPEGEIEEVRQILVNKGYVADELDRMTAAITSDHARWIEFMIAEEYGLAQNVRSPMKAAWTTFVSFVLFGAVPLVPFVFGLPSAFAISLAVTLIVFFVIGSLKSRVLAVSWWRGGLETLVTGGLAAAMAYAVGVFLKNLTD